MIHSLGPPTRDLPVLTPTMVLSLRVSLCDRQWINDWFVDQLQRRRLHCRLDWSPRLGRGPGSSSDRQDRKYVLVIINSDLYQDHGGIIYGAQGLNVNIALE